MVMTVHWEAQRNLSAFGEKIREWLRWEDDRDPRNSVLEGSTGRLEVSLER